MSIRSFLPGRLGFGSAPLGNMYRAIPDEEAADTVEAAVPAAFWEALRQEKLIAPDAPVPTA